MGAEDQEEGRIRGGVRERELWKRQQGGSWIKMGYGLGTTLHCRTLCWTEEPQDLRVCEQEESGGGLRHEVGRCLRRLLGIMVVVRSRPERVG